MIDYYRELLANLRQRPRRYLVDDTFASHVTFLVGLDIGAGRGLLAGLTEFLQTKIGQESSLAWPGIVLWLVEPIGHKPYGHRNLPAGVNEAAINRWYELLDEFLAIKQDWHGLTQIYGEYLGTLKRRGIDYHHQGAERIAAALDAVGGIDPKPPSSQDPDHLRNDLSARDHDDPRRR